MNNEMICKKNIYIESMETSDIETKVSSYIIHKSNFYYFCSVLCSALVVFCIMSVLSL